MLGSIRVLPHKVVCSGLLDGGPSHYVAEQDAAGDEAWDETFGPDGCRSGEHGLPSRAAAQVVLEAGERLVALAKAAGAKPSRKSTPKPKKPKG